MTDNRKTTYPGRGLSLSGQKKWHLSSKSALFSITSIQDVYNLACLIFLNLSPPSGKKNLFYISVGLVPSHIQDVVFRLKDILCASLAYFFLTWEVLFEGQYLMVVICLQSPLVLGTGLLQSCLMHVCVPGGCVLRQLSTYTWIWVDVF